jgi:hypothetical protein
MGCGSHEVTGACNLAWTTDGDLGEINNSCMLPSAHDGAHVCVCGQEIDAGTQDGAYFLGG